MELQSKKGLFAMPNGHDFALAVRSVAPGGYDQRVGQRVGLDYEAVITRGLKWVIESCEQRAAVVMNPVSFSVHQAFRGNNSSAQCLSDRLMTQADTQDRQLAGQLLNAFHGDTRLVWRAWAGRDHHAVRASLQDFLDADLVVAVHSDI